MRDPYRMAASQGDSVAQWKLGALYAGGESGGPPQSWTEAAALYKQSADQGNPEGTFRLGKGQLFTGNRE